MALVLNLSEVAPKSDGFFVGSVERKNVRVYGLAQCWEYVNGSACERCLADAVTRIGSCATQEARVLNAGCYCSKECIFHFPASYCNFVSCYFFCFHLRFMPLASFTFLLLVSFTFSAFVEIMEG